MDANQRPDPITKAYIAELSNKSKKLEIELVNSLILFHEQQKKDTKKTKGKKSADAGKKRPAVEAAAVAVVEPPAKKEKKKKEKPEGWLCSGNVVDGTPCPLEVKHQVFNGRLKHEGKLINACKVCKKSTKALLKISLK